MIIFARNYRGFRKIEVDLSKITLLVGDNSSGKSSIMYLIDLVSKSQLKDAPSFDEKLGIGKYDYFSPYFDHADVTFGFIGGDDGDLFGKLITVRRTENGLARVVRCSYWVPGHLYSIRSFRNGCQFRVIDATDHIDTNSFVKAHDGNNGFEKAEIENVFDIAEPLTIYRLISKNESRPSRILQTSFTKEVIDCRVISPTRALPERFYPFRRRLEFSGAHFASLWMDTYDSDSEVYKEVEKFGLESKLFDKLTVLKTSDNIPDPPLFVQVEKNGQNFTLDQVGVGVSQIVPILVHISFAVQLEDEFLLIQQPELHLHPRAQAAFGSFLFAVGNLGFRGMLETHSRYLIDRLRSDLRARCASETKDISVKESDFQIMFFANNKNGNLANIIPIDMDGRFRGSAEEYLSFFVDELIRTSR